MNTTNKTEIKTIVATINNFPPETQDNVVYFCESHNKCPQERDNILAVSDLLHRYEMKLAQYEKYELRTGYLSRWNYMPKDVEQMSSEEIQQSIQKGYQEENDWLKRCKPELPRAFIPKDWKDCISEKENPYYQQCKELINQELEKNEVFNDAFKKTVNSYAERHESNRNNGEKYVMEEVVWVFSLPLVHPNKYIYLIHVGKDNPAIKELFHVFPNFNKTVKWLSPRLREFTFKNAADFLMYYNANRNVGCSYAIDNKRIVDSFYGTTIDKSHLSLEIQSVEKTLLQSIIEKLPCHIYWLNRENMYLGSNEFQSKDFGLKSKEEIVGKTNFDFHDSDTARKLNNINELVMSTGKPYEVEEDGCYFSGEWRKCLSKKVPLFDALGKVIGLLGISFDITEKKQVEKLRVQLKIQEELYTVAKQVAHDICSPMVSLEMIKQVSSDKLSENEKKMLEMTITNIRGIANSLIGKYRGIKNEKCGINEQQFVSLYCALHDVINSKQYQYQKSNVIINYYPDNDNKFAFIEGDFSNFCRMMSNLINNAADAIDKPEGIIDISYKVNNDKVEVRVKDNGQGMPKEMADKIMNNIEVGTTKRDGHGIGMHQIKGTLKAMNARMLIKSEENVGTEFVLTFAKSEPPKSFAGKVELKKGGIVVVLDVDTSVHEIWRKRFTDFANDITVKYFTQGLEAVEFINSQKEKNKILLLTDYELKKQNLNGIDVILRSNMQDRNILVTSTYLSQIKEFQAVCGFIKICPKIFINDVTLIVN